MTSILLPLEIEQRLDAVSRANNKPKAELIKNALELFFNNEELRFPEEPRFPKETFDSYTTGKPFFGKYGSGNGNLSVEYKTRLKEKRCAKFRPN
ncbi:hypothetical protein AGMMS50230_17160 [Spirochaetia bacterium]|nr:hypothetical protein AGMMS50230_17160 [Spirochaetia bacterium]